MSLGAFAIRRPVSTIAATIAVVLLGSVSLGRLPVSLLPDVALPVLSVRTLYAGAAAAEMSRLVAEPIEAAIAATPGLIDLRSVSRNGETTTTARFAWGTNMPATVLTVRERLDQARSQLPNGVERPALLTRDPGERPIAVLALRGAGDLHAVARLAEDIHSRRLEQLDGVASVAVVGAPATEVRIEVDPIRVRALNLSFEQLASAVKSANVTVSGGTVRRGQFRLSVRTLTAYQNIEQILDTPVGPWPTGVRLRDVATASLASADARTLTRLNASPAVGLVVYKDAGANTIAVSQRIDATVRSLTAEFPDFELVTVATQAEFVRAALTNLTQEIVTGGALAVLVILLFLGDIRSSLAIGLIIPLSVLSSFVFLQALGVTLNILSLGGLALGIGLLVDNVIVVSEAAARHRDSGIARRPAAMAGVEEVAGPLGAATLTTLLVFGPIIFVRGLGATLFRDLALSVAASLGASLLLALTLFPVMIAGPRGADATHADRGPRAGRRSQRGWSQRMADLYEEGLLWCLRRPGAVFALSLLALAGTGVVAAGLPREILPQVDEGVVVADLSLTEGTALEETLRHVTRVETAARNLRAQNVYSRVGPATDEEVVAGSHAASPSSAQIVITLPGGNAEHFADRLRAAVPDLAAGHLVLDLAGQSEFGSLIGREGRVVRVDIAAPSVSDAERWAESARRVLQRLPSLADVRDAHHRSQPQVEIRLERHRLAQYGISVDEIGSALAAGFGGIRASDLRETDRRTPITIRYHASAHENLGAVLGTTVRGVPLAQLVRVTELHAPVEVVRVGQRPVVIVEGVAREGGTAAPTEDVRQALRAIAVPAGLTWSVTGGEIDRQQVMADMQLVMLLAVILVYLVLVGEFGSFTTPVLVMLTVPLAGAGAVVALWLTNQSLNLVSLIGIVVMIGVADNDALVKLAAIRRFRDQGYSVEEAIRLGGQQRLRPIVMTLLTTVAGVLPLLFGFGAAAELYRPLAAAMIGGVITATIVTLFLLPTAYAVLERRLEPRGQVAPRPAHSVSAQRATSVSSDAE